MQKRRFLNKILTIFFLSTTVAAMQPPVAHAQIPGQELARQFGRYAGTSLYYDWHMQTCRRLLAHATNLGNFQNPNLAGIIRCFYLEDARKHVKESIETGFLSVALQFFTRDSLPKHRHSFLLGIYKALYDMMGDLRSMVRDARSTDVSPMATLQRKKAQSLLSTLLLVVAFQALQVHGMRPTWKSALQRLVLQRSVYPRATTPTDDMCIICYEKDGDFVAPCPEGHRFHDACLRRWVEEKNTCPTCRNGELRTELQPLMSVDTLSVFYNNEAVGAALSKTVRVYGPIAVGLLACLFAHRRAIGELDAIKKMWEK